MKTAFASGDFIKELADKLPTPFYLYDERGIRETARRVRAAFDWNPKYREFFAVKATPNPAILRILKEEGCFVECASRPELALAKMAGFGGDDIMFSPNFPPSDDVVAAAEMKTMVNLDGPELLDFFAQRGAVRGAVGMRFNPGGEFFIDGEKVSAPGNTKFGFTLTQLIETAKKMRQTGVEGFGIQGYMGGNIMQPNYYNVLSQMLMETAVTVSRKSGLPLSYINLSGGIGVAYRPEETTPDILKAGHSVRDNYQRILAPNAMGGAAVYTELGRYMTAPHGVLVSRVVHLKRGYRDFVGLDASAHNLMRPMMYGAYHHITIAGKENRPLDRAYDVVGSVSEGIDRFAENRPLPKVEVGDVAVVHDCGAHGHSMGYNYGGKLRSAEYLLKTDGSVELIRRAETADDYLTTLV